MRTSAPVLRLDDGDRVHRADELAGLLEERPAELAGKPRAGDGTVAAADQFAVSFRGGLERRHARLVPELGVEDVLETHAAQQESRATSRSNTWAASLKPSLMVR